MKKLLLIICIISFSVFASATNISLRKVYTYSGTLNVFILTYTVSGDNVLITQSNTYNNNNFTLLWPYQEFTRNILKSLISKQR